MFTLIRGAIIIGLIFYFSPARNPDEGESPGAGRAQGLVDVSPGSKDDETRDSLWDRLASSLAEEVVRTAINEKAHGVGLHIPESSSLALTQPFPKSASADTMRRSQPEAGPTSPGQPVRCIYRCDGSE